MSKILISPQLASVSVCLCMHKWSSKFHLGLSQKNLKRIYNNSDISDSNKKTNLPAAHFSDIFTFPRIYSSPPFILSRNKPMGYIYFPTRVVVNILSVLNVKNFSKPGVISTKMLCECSVSLARPLRKLFAPSFKTGILPNK